MSGLSVLHTGDRIAVWPPNGRSVLRTSRFSFRVTVIAATVFAGCQAVALQARDRDPEPIEDPGECPIDAPVRVANIDSLRHFEGLIGHCSEATIIESPAHRANRPRGAVMVKEIELETGWKPPVERGPRGAKSVASVGPAKGSVGGDRANDPAPLHEEERTRTYASEDGSQVSIRPPAPRSPPPAVIVPVVAPTSFSTSDLPAAQPAGDTAAADSNPDIEVILALRPRSYSTAFDNHVAAAARAHNVDPLLLHAVIKQESGYRAQVVSHAGARGLMQVMPGTGRMMGVRNAQALFDPNVNIGAGAKLLSQLWRRFDGNIDLVLAAYNAGEGAVRKYGMTVPPYRETRDYVKRVKANYALLAMESGLAVKF